MARKFITALTLTTVIATGLSATSARAEPRFGDVLAATIFLFALGSALEGAEVTPTPPSASGPDMRAPRGAGDRHGQRRALPGQCFQRYTTQQGTVRSFDKNGLQQNYRFANRLPESCAETLWTDQGLRRGYSPSCLRSEGYHIDRR